MYTQVVLSYETAVYPSHGTNFTLEKLADLHVRVMDTNPSSDVQVRTTQARQVLALYDLLLLMLTSVYESTHRKYVVEIGVKRARFRKHYEKDLLRTTEPLDEAHIV